MQLHPFHDGLFLLLGSVEACASVSISPLRPQKVTALPPVSRGPLCKTLLKCWMRKTNWNACGWSFRSANACIWIVCCIFYIYTVYMGYIYVYILLYISTVICNTYFSLNWTYAVGRVCVHDEWLVLVTTYNYTFTAKVGDLDAGPDA